VNRRLAKPLQHCATGLQAPKACNAAKRDAGSHTLMFLQRRLLTTQPLHFVAPFTPAACFTDCNLLGVVAPWERPCPLTLTVCPYSFTRAPAYLYRGVRDCHICIRLLLICTFHACLYLDAHILRRTNVNVYRCGLTHSPHPSLYFHNISAYIRLNSNYLAIYNCGRISLYSAHLWLYKDTCRRCLLATVILQTIALFTCFFVSHHAQCRIYTVD